MVVSIEVKVDEDLPPAVAVQLREAGYATMTVVEQGLGGTADAELYEKVRAEGRFLVTADKGFGDIRTYPPGTHSGILVLRPDEDGIPPLLELMRRVLRSGSLDRLREAVCVATPRGVRVRRNEP